MSIGRTVVVVACVGAAAWMCPSKADTSDGPSCDVVHLDPAKYVGKQVSFFGTRVAHSEADGRETVSCLCTTKAGEIIPNGAFMFCCIGRGFHNSGEQRSEGRDASHRNGERHGKIYL
jgi:hypothetical protein